MRAAFAPAMVALSARISETAMMVGLVHEAVAATVIFTCAEVMLTGSIRCAAPVGKFDAGASAVVAFSVAEVTTSRHVRLQGSSSC
jgi:hypothetical protein